MKNFLIELICALLLLPSCSIKSDVQLPVQKTDLLERLDEYNSDVMSKTVTTKSPRNRLIVSADAVGALNGVSDGGSIGFWAGVAFGNPAVGKAAGAIIGGVLVGGAYSLITFLQTTENECDADSLYDQMTASLLQSGVLRGIVINEDGTITYSEGYDSGGLVQSDTLSTIVSVGHNEVLLEELNPSASNVDSLMEGIQPEFIELINNPSMRDVFISRINGIFRGVHNGLGVSSVVDAVMNRYFTAYEATVDNTAEAAVLSEAYIEMINESDELTEEERAGLTGALTVAVYSTDFWNSNL